MIQLLLEKDRHSHTYNGCCSECTMPTTHHILFECSSVRNERKALWSKVVEVCPTNLIMEINCMSSEKKCEFILNGLYCSFVLEWQDIYAKLAEFVNVLYRQYSKANK